MNTHIAEADHRLDIGLVWKEVRRRIKPALIAFVVVVVIFGTLALKLPALYRSSATVLIEQQEIPQDLVRTTVSSFAAQRIQVLIQRAMTFSNLSDIIKKYDLYADLRESDPLEQVVEKMREDIEHRMISAEVVDPRSGRPVEATIAFAISYVNPDATTAQQVTSEIVSLFLEENLRNRAELAEQAETFLGDELKRLEIRMRQLESALADFKEQNLSSLPEQNTNNLNMIERTEREYDEIRRQIQGVEERKVYLETQLAQIEPYQRVVGDGREAVMTAEGRIRFLQNQYLTLSATYSDSHPDVVKTRRELEESLQSGIRDLDRSVVEQQLKILRHEQNAMKLKYSADYPEVRTLARKIAEFDSLLATLPLAPKGGGKLNADNPAYLQLQASLESARIELSYLKESKSRLQRKLEDHEAALQNAPRVEKEYRDLLRDLDNTSSKYQEVKAKQMEAQMARTLETERKAERFTLIEPPLVPQRPVSPNRPLIFGFGIALALGVAAVLVWLLGRVDGTVRSAQDVLKIIGVEPLVTIPHIVTLAETSTRKRKRVLASVAGFGVVLVAMVVTHFAVAPLDVLWYVTLRKLG